MSEIMVPIFVCCVLPIAVVLITCLTKINEDNKRSQILIKAIESNQDVDTNKLLESFSKPRKTARQILNLRLLRGCIFGSIGLVLLIIAIVNLACGSDMASGAVESTSILGSISLAIGVSYLIVYSVTRKQIEKSEEE